MLPHRQGPLDLIVGSQAVNVIAKNSTFSSFDLNVCLLSFSWVCNLHVIICFLIRFKRAIIAQPKGPTSQQIAEKE
ncbi:unnamed protein product [Linum trigynum]|uniref:Uncharacterized protein n=1 Tax=Linum trigynum TaxID=586398 RepID=A0AAV2ED99_9ROSI